MSCRTGESPRYPTGKTGDAFYKGLLAENEERVNRKAAFLAARDAEYAAWKEQNGVVDVRAETTDAETGMTTVTESRGMVCGGAMSIDLGKMYNIAQASEPTRWQQRRLRDHQRSEGRAEKWGE